ncbi:MAG: hypothetical protein IJX34_04100 [Clostridia bacterium]|nr:hypothetical protein [Clostridia bacterium]
MNKKKIGIIVLIIIAIILFLVIIRNYILGFKVKSHYEVDDFFANIENVSDISIYKHNFQYDTMHLIELEEEKEELISLISNAKLKRPLTDWVGGARVVIMKNEKTGGEIRISIGPSWINIDHKQYRLIEDNDNQLYNRVKEILDKYDSNSI